MSLQTSKDINSFIKWKKNVHLASVMQDSTQILVLDDMKMSKTVNLYSLFGHKVLKDSHTNYLTELSLANTGITFKHLLKFDEDGFHFFRSMPFLKSLNLANNNLGRKGLHWLVNGISGVVSEIPKSNIKAL